MEHFEKRAGEESSRKPRKNFFFVAMRLSLMVIHTNLLVAMDMPGFWYILWVRLPRDRLGADCMALAGVCYGDESEHGRA